MRKPFRELSQVAILPKLEVRGMMHLGESLEFGLFGTKDPRWPHFPIVERLDSFLRDVLQALLARRESPSASQAIAAVRR